MKNYRTKEWMCQKYVTEELSLEQVAKEAGVHPHTIWENLVRLEIPRRKSGPIRQTDEAKARISVSAKGRKPMSGKTHSVETRQLMSAVREGVNNPNWKGGLTLQTRHFRKSKQYREWRLSVLGRDNFTCQYEGCSEKTNIAHHIKPVKSNPGLKLDVSNGMAVCDLHHKLIHKQLKDEKQ